MGLDALYNMLAKPVRAGIERARRVQRVMPESAIDADDHQTQTQTQEPSYRLEHRKRHSSRRRFRADGRRKTDKQPSKQAQRDKFVPATEEQLAQEAQALADEQHGKHSTSPRDSTGKHVDIEI
ncbi:MAG: hypothetical protein LPD71_13340 [Shewanella sp.]|nr:hypothetical protein [Shewanella sp.]MCF1429932.1 hypothetical protein [Shewanella sp.]MCF1439680.1 hypothetical protein [Shewanella sp.]MCF1456753.1 hypothetical protein [Shewanella sp.]